MVKIGKRSSTLVLGVLGLGTYLLASTVFMLKSKGELNGITLVMPKRMEEKRLESQLVKEQEKRSKEASSGEGQKSS